MNQLRKSILEEEDKVASRIRFGLFSQPPPIAVGDDAGYSKSLHKKGQDGKPVTDPPQLLAGTCKTGQMKSSFFSVPQSIYIKDKYQQTHKLENEYQKKMHSKASFHETQFKPASGTQPSAKPAYEYIGQKSDNKKGIRRDQNGRVKTEPPNIQSNPTQKVQRQFLKFPKYENDPYQRQRQMEREFKEKQKRKLLPVDTIFKSASHGNRTFSKNSESYGQDQKAKSILKQKQRVKTIASVEHEQNFKLAIGHGQPLGRYPEFIDSVLNKNYVGHKKSLIKRSQNKDRWKYNHYNKTRPTPSIGLNLKNLHVSRNRK